VIALMVPPVTPSRPSSKVLVQNVNKVAGSVDFYAYGVSSGHRDIPFGIRAVGAQSFPRNAADNYVLFAFNTYKPVPNVADLLIDFNIYLNGSTTPSFLVRTYDLALLQGASTPSGQAATAVFNLTTGAGVIRFLATAPFDGSTFEMLIRGSDIGLTSTALPASGRFQYDARVAYPFGDDTTPFSVFSDTTGDAKGWFNSFNPAIVETGPAPTTVPVGPLERQLLPVNLRMDEWAVAPAKGLMIVDLDNSNGAFFNQALLLEVPQH
jgi:hypothetical protein